MLEVRNICVVVLFWNLKTVSVKVFGNDSKTFWVGGCRGCWEIFWNVQWYHLVYVCDSSWKGSYGPFSELFPQDIRLISFAIIFIHIFQYEWNWIPSLAHSYYTYFAAEIAHHNNSKMSHRRLFIYFWGLLCFVVT